MNLGDEDKLYKIDNSYLHCTVDAGGNITDVYFQYPGITDPSIISVTPDGYWEMRACVFNEWDQPGNTWRLPCRVETGVPAAPTDVIASSYGDNTILLQWTPGEERDRLRWELFRIRRGDDGIWPPWPNTPTAIVSPFTAQYSDVGNVLLLTDPWGTLDTTNAYQYLIRAVDVAGQPGGEAVSPVAYVPGETTSTTAPTTTTLVTSTTTESTYTVLLSNTTNADREFVITKDGREYFRQILAKKPKSGAVPTVPVSGLPAGTYTVTASRIQGSPQTDSGTFVLPSQANTVVFYH